MPFGLSNAPFCFQEVMDNLFSGDMTTFVLPYLDEILILSETVDEHREHLQIVLAKIRAANLSLNPKNASFIRQH
jgi:hypothetical protein